MTVDTFDDFTYTVKLGKKQGENYPLTMAVTANFPKERTAILGEKPEDKDKADKAWQDRQKLLASKLKDTKAFENHIFLVPAWSVDMILKDRKDLMEEKKPETKPDETAGTPAEKKDETPSLAPEAPKP